MNKGIEISSCWEDIDLFEINIQAAIGTKVISKTSNDAVAPLYIAEPFKGIDVKTLFSTHPPIEERIKRLKEMAYVRQSS